jgi:hypothetical protein
MERIEVWFAWHPVVTKQRKLAWFRKVVRVWNPRARFSIIDPYDLGDYEGAWEYHG